MDAEISHLNNKKRRKEADAAGLVGDGFPQPAPCAPAALTVAWQRCHPGWVVQLEPGGATSTPVLLSFTDTTKTVTAPWGISY